eukprot:s2113_g6.t1
MLGRRILEALTTAYGRMIFSSGFIHGDPHPGNIFILEGGKVALIDCGQVAQLFREQRLLVAEAILAASVYDGSRGMIELLANCVRKFGVTFFDGQEDEDACAASVALYLFGEKDVTFPGGYSKEEFSSKSPLRQQGTRGSLSLRNPEISWDSLWMFMDECRLPAWALQSAMHRDDAGVSERLRFRDAARGCASLVRRWGIEKAASMLASRKKEDRPHDQLTRDKRPELPQT